MSAHNDTPSRLSALDPWRVSDARFARAYAAVGDQGHVAVVVRVVQQVTAVSGVDPERFQQGDPARDQAGRHFQGALAGLGLPGLFRAQQGGVLA